VRVIAGALAGTVAVAVCVRFVREGAALLWAVGLEVETLELEDDRLDRPTARRKRSLSGIVLFCSLPNL
jgi:hypothetical protein